MDNVPNTNTSYVFPSIKVLGIANLNDIQINGRNGPAGYLLTATGNGAHTVWAPPSSAGASQWTGATGNPIYYVPNVGIGSVTTPTAKLQVLGNVYASNALTTTDVYAVRYYGDGGFLSNVNASGIVVSVKKVTASYSVQLSDYYIGVNGTAVVITLPLGSSVATGKTYVVKDESGLVTPNSVYRFTIQGSGSDLIDASTSITVTVSFISLTFLWNGTRWSII